MSPMIGRSLALPWKAYTMAIISTTVRIIRNIPEITRPRNGIMQGKKQRIDASSSLMAFFIWNLAYFDSLQRRHAITPRKKKK